MPRLTSRDGLPYEELGLADFEYGPVPVSDDEGGAGNALLMFGAIALGVTLYWWDVEGKANRRKAKLPKWQSALTRGATRWLWPRPNLCSWR